MIAKPGRLTLVTVNKSSIRAERIIARFLTAVEASYDIQYVANCATIGELRKVLLDKQPNILFCASTWTPVEARQIIAIAVDAVPDLKTHVVPQGLVDRDGEDAMVEHLAKAIDGIITGEDQSLK